MAKAAITMDDILSNEELHNELTGIIRKWYIESEDYMGPKVKLFKEWYKKFTNPGASTSDKIKINMLYQHLKAFISTYYEDGLNVGIEGREFLDDDYAYMLETCARYDYTVMNKKQKDFFHILNLGFYGVSLFVKNGFDVINNVTTYDVISPEYWKPDPNGNIMRGFKYHMFDFVISDEEIKNANSVDDINPVYREIDKYQKVSTEAKDTKNLKKGYRALGTTDYNHDYSGTRVFFEYRGRKYMAELFNQRTVIGRFEEIKPVDDVEKKYPHTVPFPVEVANIFPLEDDPCGVGLSELILDFQNAKNRLMNLSLKTEEWNAGFKVLLADISKISDPELLGEKPIDGPIIVPYDGSAGPLNSAVVQPIMDGIKADQSTLNLANILDMEAQAQTSYTAQNRGLGGSPGTLGEAKMAQVNSNIIFSLDSEVISRCEVNFWKNIWFRGLKEYLPANVKKYARIGNGIASNEAMISGDDIKSHNDPDIVVSSKKSVTEKNKKILDRLMAREAVIMANPLIPAISKMFYQRDIAKYSGEPREKIYLNYPLTADERSAIRAIKLINSDIAPESMFYPGMDLWTYYIYLQKCKEGTLKRKALAEIERLMKKEGLNKMENPGNSNDLSQLTNSMSSQLTSNVAQQSGVVNNYPTRADVLS